MSRTYRKVPEYYTVLQGHLIHWKDKEGKKIENEFFEMHGGRSAISVGLSGVTIYGQKGRDKKPWDKPNKAFKQMRARKERRKAKHDIVNGREPIPLKKTDQWDWT